MKKVVKTVAIFSLLLIPTFLEVRADYKGFNIKSGYFYTQDPHYNAKNNNEYLMGIKWKSSGAGTHKEWFRVVNSRGEQKAEGLLNAPSSKTIFLETTAKNGYYYYLQARREHIINPVTQVRGTWQP